MSAADWQTLKDPATSHTYYYNSKTNVTTWEMPAELRAAATAAPAPAPAPAVAASGWARHFDPNSKNYYYFNATTKQTSWTDPTQAATTTVVTATTATTAAPAAAAPAVVAAPASQPGTPSTPARTGIAAAAAAAAANRTLGGAPNGLSATGHKLPPPLPPTPKAKAAVDAAAAAPATPAAAAEQKTPPAAATPAPVVAAVAAVAAPTANDLFDRFHDSSHNAYYYVNKQTKASQWEMPAGWVDPSELAARRPPLKLQPTGTAAAAGTPSLAVNSLSAKTKTGAGFNSLPGPLQPGQLAAAAAAGGFASPLSSTPQTPNLQQTHTPHTPYTPVQAPLSQSGAGTGGSLPALYGTPHMVTPPTSSTPSTPGYGQGYTQAPMSNPGRSATMMSLNSNSTVSGAGAGAAAAGSGAGVQLPHAAANALASLGGLSGLSGSAKAALAVFKPAKVDDNVVRFDSTATKHARSQSVVVGASPGSATLPANFTMPVGTIMPSIDAKTGRPAGLPTPLRGDIAKFALDGFAKEHFRSAKKAQSKKTIPVEQELSWQKEPIKKSLLAAAKAYDSACVKLFASIQAFMLETGKRNAMQLLDAVVTQGVQKAPLRDEIYCQLTKQTRNNPNPAGAAEGWKLFAICVSAFAPTREFQNYLVNYFIDNYDSPIDEVRVLAPYCYFRLHKTVKDGPEPLKLAEVEQYCKSGGPRSATVTWGGNVSYIVSLQKQEGMPIDVPLIMYSLIDTIRKLNGLGTKGIFRLAAEGQLVKNHVLQCKSASGLTGSAAYEMKHNDVHVAADTLKIWLRELAEPLMPLNLYDAAIKAAENPQSVVHILTTLPKPQFDTWDFLLNFMCDLAANEQATAMGPENISVVFSPNLLRSTEVDPAFLFRNEGKVRSFVKNAVIYWMKNKPVPYAGTGAVPNTPPAAAPGTPAAKK